MNSVSMIPEKKILGINISIIDPPQLIEGIDALVQKSHPTLVNNVNVHACNLAFENPQFKQILNASEIVFCDGFGVKLAGWLTGNRLGQRMTPPDWIDDLFDLCVRQNYSVYFLGDTEEVVNRFAEEVQTRFPGLKIAGSHHGFFPLQGKENQQVVQQISDAGADIIITGMGMPRQELWAWEAKLHLNKGVIIATGALFCWYTGVDKRAPKWVTDCGMEWLARLLCNPVRHFKRYVIGLPLFFWRVIRCHWFRAGGGSNE